MGFWHDKPRDQRFKDTYAFIEASGMPDAALNVTLMNLRTRTLAVAGQLNALNEVMSLGSRWELIKSAAETRRRHYIRSVLFGYATLGDPNHQGRPLMNVNNVDDVQKKKRDTMGLTETQLQQLLTSMSRVKREGNRTFVGFDSSLEEKNAVWALDQIAQAVTRVQFAIGNAMQGSPEETRFRTWFGASNRSMIRQNYNDILVGINNGICLIKDTDPAEIDTRAYVLPNEPKDPPRVYLCAEFWKACNVTWQEAGGKWSRKDAREADDNVLGILLHELSHLFLNTDDHERGQFLCKELVKSKRRHSLARMNADNYKYYAESVMTADF